MPFCYTCGTKLADNTKFCPTCGSKQEIKMEVDASPAASTSTSTSTSTSAAVHVSTAKPVPVVKDESLSVRSETTVGSITIVKRDNNDAVIAHCKACNRNITAAEGVVNALDASWHKDCFKCKICKTKIFSFAKFGELDGFPICLNCARASVPNCSGCRKAIEGPHVVVGDRHFHEKCLICANCKRPAKKDFYEDGGKIYHLVCE
eukprot:TRINITY_DN922_c0_g1_i1.p1 TRINITY_DN922_c0_g1~~TRINITY_DN922_c0_g1_i1.p1  ORF type:complete len:212 (-),score=47.50 TRINITY_DN922_c0_g1_i1:68-682(-)